MAKRYPGGFITATFKPLEPHGDNTSLYTFGYNTYGALGDNTVVKRSSPIQVGALTTWSKIDGGSGHTIATKTDGTLWTWGLNNKGQLGDNTVVNRSSPVQVGALTTWSKIAGGGYHNIALSVE